MTTKQPPEISEAAVKTGVQKAHLRWDRVLIGGFLAADSVHGRGVHARAHPQDSHRHPDKRRCCALGRCCHTTVSPRTLSDIRGCLRAALAQAVTEEIISRNVAAAVKLPKVRSRATRRQAWSSEEARVFFESARTDHDPLYAGYVLILVLGLRKGEVLGLTWDHVDLDQGRLWVALQLQRVGRQLLHRETKTEGSTVALPCPTSA